MLLLAAVLSLAVGLSLGLLGGGGSILTLPMLVYVLHVGPREAIASSLFVVAATSAIASLAHARSGAVQWRVGGVFAAAAMIGAFGGGRAAHLVPAPILLGGFAVMMLVTAIAIMRGRREPKGEQGLAVVRVLAVATLVGALLGAGEELLGAPGDDPKRRRDLVRDTGCERAHHRNAVGATELVVATAGNVGNGQLPLELELVALVATRNGPAEEDDGRRNSYAR